MSTALRNLLRACYMPLVRRAARCYIAGLNVADALQTCRQLLHRGYASSIGYWNEDGESPRDVADTHLATLDDLAREGLNCSLSVKAPPLRFDRSLLTEIIERARAGNLLIHFDSLAPDAADETFAVIARQIGHYPRIGCTLPGRWMRSVRDADLAVDLQVSVRVVKGQWVDPAAPYLDMGTGFLAVIDRLAGRASHVGVATHDAALAREALRRLRTANTPCELELLLGLPMRPALQEAEAAGVPTRFYVMYGRGAIPYGLSQVHQNPRVVWWVIRDQFRSHALPPPPRHASIVGAQQA